MDPLVKQYEAMRDEISELKAENSRLKADVHFYQQNERDHYRRAAGYVTAQYRQKADRLVHENVSLRGQIAELRQEHEKQIKWREADSHYWYRRGFKAEQDLKEARAEVEKLRGLIGEVIEQHYPGDGDLTLDLCKRLLGAVTSQ